jgi:hypothetical protein
MSVHPRYEALTPEVRELAKRTTMDGVQAILAGSLEAAGNLATDLIQERSSPVMTVLRKPSWT